MKIDTKEFANMPGLMSARLSESADAAAALELTWSGYGPEWLEYMEPVTLMHRGRVLFHGRLISYTRTNEAGETETTATAKDALWLLDHLTLGAQIAEALAANNGREANLTMAARNAMVSWAALAESCRVNAPQWVVTEGGEVLPEAEVRLDVSRANYSSGAAWKKEGMVTQWTALLVMKEANPDAFYRYRPTTGAVEVVSLKRAEKIEWNTEQMRLEACAEVAPQYENSITGVALLVSWDKSADGDGALGGAILQVYPEGVEASDMGVKLYTAHVKNYVQATQQAHYMMRQLKSYYDAVNELQHSGSVRALLDDVESSPLCSRMSVTGAGTHEEWHDMASMVTGVAWDFVAGVVEVQLGTDMGEPHISEMVFPDEPEEDETTEEGGGGDFEWPTSSEDTTTASNLPSWDLNSTQEEEMSTTWEETTTTWEENISLSETTTTWEETTTTWDETDTASASESEELTFSTWDDIFTTGGGESATWGDSDTTTWDGSSTGSRGSGSSGSGSDGGTASGSSDGGTASGSDDCGWCTEKWAALEAWKAGMEERLAALEAALEGSCDCACAGLLEDIQKAVNEAAAGVNLTASVTASVMTTNTGDLKVNATAEASGGSGSASVSFQY